MISSRVSTGSGRGFMNLRVAVGRRRWRREGASSLEAVGCVAVAGRGCCAAGDVRGCPRGVFRGTEWSVLEFPVLCWPEWLGGASAMQRLWFRVHP